MEELTKSKIKYDIERLHFLGYKCDILESEYNNNWYDVRIKKDNKTLSLATFMSDESVHMFLFGYYCAIVDLKHYEVFC